MTRPQTELWEKVRRFTIDDPDAAFTFSDRLARENGWSKEYALEVIEEYKKFMFLNCIAEHHLTPSDQVDQVWHLHLVYTRSYWIDFCANTIKRDVHHGPTKGGNVERKRYTDYYHMTLQLYEQTFGSAAPSHIWPDADKRFSDIHFKRVNISTHWIVPKPSIFYS